VRHDSAVISHPWRPGAVGEALAQLAGWSRTPEPAATAAQLADQALALAVRGDAWRRFGRLDLAGLDLDAAAAILTSMAVEVSRALLDEVQQRRLELAARVGDRAQALTLMTALLRDALSAEIRLERLRGRPELVALLRDEDWAALAALARE
jgi:hypothetical protein